MPWYRFYIRVYAQLLIKIQKVIVSREVRIFRNYVCLGLTALFNANTNCVDHSHVKLKSIVFQLFSNCPIEPSDFRSLDTIKGLEEVNNFHSDLVDSCDKLVSTFISNHVR